MLKKPHPVDVEVGMNIKNRRLLLNITQQELGAALGVTFQQVQKYKRGTNRVSASCLQMISAFLRVPIPSLFPEGGAEASHVARAMLDELNLFLSSQDGRDLTIALANIRSRVVRKRILDLVICIAGGAEDGE